MPFNQGPGQAPVSPNFANYYRQANPINKLQGQMGPQAEVPQNPQLNAPSVNPGGASIAPSPELLNRLMSQPLPPAAMQQGPPQGSPMLGPPMQGQRPMPQPMGNQPMRRPMPPTANGRMGY